ncbi:MAG: 4Fe-4S binding protein [Elusimicrobia bacterium]|nr:4Fe-4S binding protein [Elusimicrobiota bacterium]
MIYLIVVVVCFIYLYSDLEISIVVADKPSSFKKTFIQGRSPLNEKNKDENIAECSETLELCGKDIKHTSVCLRCYRCVSQCPENAILPGDSGIPEINTEICLECGRCVAACPSGALQAYFE